MASGIGSGGKIAPYQRDRERFCHNGDSYEEGDG
jgi:hypothetical protein